MFQVRLELQSFRGLRPLAPHLDPASGPQTPCLWEFHFLEKEPPHFQTSLRAWMSLIKQIPNEWKQCLKNETRANFLSTFNNTPYNMVKVGRDLGNILGMSSKTVYVKAQIRIRPNSKLLQPRS